MRKSLFFIVWILLPIAGLCQNKCYHLLDYTCASCPPAVLLWNADKSQAVALGNYVEEYTDSLQRVTKLLSFFDNKNRRAVIDDWDYILYEYTDSAIVVTSLVAPQWWYPMDTTDCYYSGFAYGAPTAERFVVKYDSGSQTHNIISSTYQTIRGWDYYATQLVDCNYYPTYEQAYDYVKSLFIYTEEPDSLVRMFREPSEAYVPYYSYSYYKNGPTAIEPMGVILRANRIY